MDFTFDRVPGARASITAELIEVVRACHVKNIPVVDGVTGTDSEVLLKIIADPDCPRYGSFHPSTISPWSLTTLQEINIRSWSAADACLLDLVYRAKSVQGGSGAAASWRLEYDNTISHVQTFNTWGGQNLIKVWYKAGTASGTTSKPSGADEKGAAVTKMNASGVLTATALLSGTDWQAIRANIKAMRNHVNGDQWGSSPRGTWFFPGPRTVTTDYGKSYTVQLPFLENPDGWYPVVSYLDFQGNHPADSDKESVFPSFFPTLGAIQQLNGLARASEYNEDFFTPVFAFTPDDA